MADIEAHFHGGPLEGERRALDALQSSYEVLDDTSGQRGYYVQTDWRASTGRCFAWTEWQPL